MVYIINLIYYTLYTEHILTVFSVIRCSCYVHVFCACIGLHFLQFKNEYTTVHILTSNFFSTVGEIIQYARGQGVCVIPEIDSSAHVGEGWQHTGLVTCFNWQPWYLYCVEPPCGQFDPTKDKLYDVLEGYFSFLVVMQNNLIFKILGVFGNVIEQFQSDILHIGGNEVKDNCWNSTSNIVNWMLNNSYELTEVGFIQLRMYYQNKTVERIYKQLGKKIPLIIWQSSLTDAYSKYLSNDQFVIHVWYSTSTINAILEDGFKVILSNYDPMYLDCGFSIWYWKGNNWCTPYKGRQDIYGNSPVSIAGIEFKFHIKNKKMYTAF